MIQSFLLLPCNHSSQPCWCFTSLHNPGCVGIRKPNSLALSWDNPKAKLKFQNSPIKLGCHIISDIISHIPSLGILSETHVSSLPYPASSTPLAECPDSVSLISHLHTNFHRKICFWGTNHQTIKFYKNSLI